MRSFLPFSSALFVLLAAAAPAAAATLSVGPGKTYATPCAAIAKAAAGDVILVDAGGTYTGDTCSWTTDNLTIRGINGLAKIDVTALSASPGGIPGGKGIFTIYAPNATVESFELSGASVSSANGAGIRHQGLNLTVRNCYFHDNEDGILGGPLNNGQPALGQGTVIIEDSEFANNGAGDGFSHNMYIGEYASFTLQGSWSHLARVGHLVKTRAHENYILYNRITGEGGTDSYEIDVPQGGKTFIIGNLIEQGPNSQNPAIITFKEEGPTNPILDLFVVNNSIVNDLGKGTFVHVDASVTTPAVLQNNIFVGTGTVCDQASAVQTTNFTGNPMFVSQATYDYHLAAGSPCVDKGTTPGMGDGYALTPTEEYLPPLKTEGRTIVNVIDIGAYELGGAVQGTGGGSAASSSSTGSSAAATGSSATASSSSSTSGAGVGGATSSGTGGSSAGTGGTASSSSGGGPGAKSGCSCEVTGETAGAPAVLLGALAWLAKRSRRAKRRAA